MNGWLTTFFLLITVLLVLPIVHSAGIDKAITTATLEDSTAQITSEYVIVSDKVQNLNLPVPSDVKSVSAALDDESIECKLENSTALCGSTKQGTHVFTLKYESKEVLASLQDRQLFKFSEQLPFKTSEYTFVLKLPVGTIIPKEKEADFFLTPKPAQVLSDGQRIIITWNATNTNNFAVSAVLQPLQEITLPIVIGLIVLGAAVSAVWYYTRKKKPVLIKKKIVKPKQEEALVPRFVENEQQIVKILQEAPNNEAWQKYLLEKTGFSKAKLSRIIRNLEERGVVVKTIYGNTNKISLKK